MLVAILAVLGVGTLALAVIGFLSKPNEASVKIRQVEARGPIAVAVLGVGLLCGAATLWSDPHAISSASARGEGASEQEPPPSPEPVRAGSPRLRSPGTIAVPYYGILQIGGSCRGEHLLSATWNCDASRTKRVACQNGMVVVDPCPEACTQHRDGVNDECR